jgi:hypothetical protein
VDDLNLPVAGEGLRVGGQTGCVPACTPSPPQNNDISNRIAKGSSKHDSKAGCLSDCDAPADQHNRGGEQIQEFPHTTKQVIAGGYVAAAQVRAWLGLELLSAEQ